MVYCFNCKKQGHGFKHCINKLNFCKSCKTQGHNHEQCEFFNKLCYMCTENGYLKVTCKKHENLKRCGAIIFDKSKNILLVQNHSGIWSCPKGHQKYENESFKQCAMREIYEETGLKLKITNTFKQIRIGNIIYFVIKLDEYFKKFLKINDKHEIKKIKWIYKDDISNLKKINWSLKQISKLNSFF